MHDWQHAIASGILAGLLFWATCGVSALHSVLVWRFRHRLDLVELKTALAFLTLLPSAVALLVALFPYALPSCIHHATCYLGWLEATFGDGVFRWLHPLALLAGGMLLVWLVEMVRRAVAVFHSIRQLVALSHPPSPKLQSVLEKGVPRRWHARFREVALPSRADGVYGGICLLSQETVQNLSERQLQAVVAHEWQHLRARDGWFALVVGLLVSGVGLGTWSRAYRYWSDSAELLADARATHLGVARTELARTLLQRQAEAQGVPLGFSADSALLEERLRYLLSPASASGSARWLWAPILGCAGVLLYAVWQTGSASICTIHCVLF